MKLAALSAFFAASAFASPLLNAFNGSDGSLQVTAQNAPTNYVSVDGVQIAYRRLGNPSDLPLVFMTHFLGCMDTNDPLLLNLLGLNREVIIFDNAGVGHSGGTIPNNVSSMGETAVNFLGAIGVTNADFMGFSLGGFIAQYISLEYPQLVNRLILSGTQSGVGPLTAIANLSALVAQTPGTGPDENTFLLTFFYPSNTSQAAGQQWWERINERNVTGEERTGFVGPPGNLAQFEAISTFVGDTEFFYRLPSIQVPVLISGGKRDLITPSVNSFAMQQEILNARLAVYPDSGHGHLYQFAENLVLQVDDFLA